MNLCAEMLLDYARTAENTHVSAVRICPPFRRRLSALPGFGRRKLAKNADRFLNRHLYFPRHLRGCREHFDFFHICDHSYSQLALELPGERTGIFCHDVDAFRSLVEPHHEPRPAWYRWMMNRVLHGFHQAAVVFYTTSVVRDEILRLGLVTDDKLVHAPLGHAAEFTADPKADSAADRILAGLRGRPFLLHVGTCIPRKRVDFLLRVFATVRMRLPNLRLVKVGGTWSADQIALIRLFGIENSISHVQKVPRSTLAVLYRRAALVMLPSDAEGFGLPVVEALACGAPLMVSDIPVLREVGGGAALYAPLLDLDYWCERVTQVLKHSNEAPPKETRVAQAEKYSWKEHARTILQTYEGLAARQGLGCGP